MICLFSWLGSSCLEQEALTDCIIKDYLCDIFLKLSVCLKCMLRREVPFNFIFIWNNMEPVGFLVFFVTLRAQGMRRRWRWRQSWGSSTLSLFVLLLTSHFSSSRLRTILWRRRCATSFLCLSYLVRFSPFWTKLFFLFFWAMRTILLIFLITYST